ncbi:uncharacterized protein LOC132544774 [Ylistrum balloti]|uniref:uncharacterized protein LOC132544774 n=1 Tax=Ylistrum balloti TaxID=509963 RepID=UPI002905D592|nr:uncharacterized protein LOC132544774 [Ylistrum balloti]
MNAIRCFIKSQKEWYIHLPQKAGVLRCSVNRQTLYTANQLMLGRETNQPADILYRNPPGEKAQDVDTYVEKLIDVIQSANDVARRTLKTSQKRMKRDYDVREHETRYKVGDVVFIFDTATPSRQNPKLKSVWKGPGVIMKCYTPHVYEVHIGRSEKAVNHAIEIMHRP